MKTELEEIAEYKAHKAKNIVYSLTRIDIINQLIKKFNYINYLEIGVNDGSCIRNVIAAHKDGVDPGIETINPPEVNYPITSDSFFELIRGHDIKYDIIFIDGLHHDYQVYKDIRNALNHITDNGTIVCHDMNPLWEITQRKTGVVGTWNGDCWKAWVQLRSELKDYSMEVVDTDHGVGIIRKGSQQLLTLDKIYTELTYDYLYNNRQHVLNLVDVDYFLNKYKLL
jgi:hypothetical protein